MARGSSAASGEGSSGRGSSAAGSRGSSAAGAAAAATADAGAVVDVEGVQQDVQLAEVRLVTRTMLQELGTLVQQHPGGSKCIHQIPAFWQFIQCLCNIQA